MEKVCPYCKTELWSIRDYYNRNLSFILYLSWISHRESLFFWILKAGTSFTKLAELFILVEISSRSWVKIHGFTQINSLRRIEILFLTFYSITKLFYIVLSNKVWSVSKFIMFEVYFCRNFIKFIILQRDSQFFWFLWQFLVNGQTLSFESVGGLFYLSSKIRFQQLWLFKLCKYFFGFVDWIFEIYATIMKSFRIIHTWVL